MKYNVLNAYEAQVNTLENPYNFEQKQLFEMALRINKKRRFLFVSHVLGKHLAVDPAIPLLMSHLLAYQFAKQRFDQTDALVEQVTEAIKTRENLRQVLAESQASQLVQPKAMTIIGFAETATALGHGFFEKLTGDVQYVHTTREDLVEVEPVISFEEEHSHATSHRVYADESIFLRDTEIILVDDEMTTGKTNSNIIRQLKAKYPHLKTFTLVSILDFRTEQSRKIMEDMADELAITVHSVSLFTGEFEIKETDEEFSESHPIEGAVNEELVVTNFEEVLKPSLKAQPSYNAKQQIQYANYYEYSGRFTLTSQNQQKITADIEKVAHKLKEKRSEGDCLVLGTGEFMYIPMRLANQMGEDIRFHASTRSPIFAHEQSLVYNKLTFESAELPGVTNYLYNIPSKKYVDIFVVYERIMDFAAAEKLYAQLKPYAENLHFVTLGGIESELST